MQHHKQRNIFIQHWQIKISFLKKYIYIFKPYEFFYFFSFYGSFMALPKASLCHTILITLKQHIKYDWRLNKRTRRKELTCMYSLEETTRFKGFIHLVLVKIRNRLSSRPGYEETKVRVIHLTAAKPVFGSLM